MSCFYVIIGPLRRPCCDTKYHTPGHFGSRKRDTLAVIPISANRYRHRTRRVYRGNILGGLEAPPLCLNVSTTLHAELLPALISMINLASISSAELYFAMLVGMM
jgi:hypothetical protein